MTDRQTDTRIGITRPSDYTRKVFLQQHVSTVLYRMHCWQTRSIARLLCDSWASCCKWPASNAKKLLNRVYRNKGTGFFAPKTIRSWKRNSRCEIFAPWNFRILELSLPPMNTARSLFFHGKNMTFRNIIIIYETIFGTETPNCFWEIALFVRGRFLDAPCI